MQLWKMLALLALVPASMVAVDVLLYMSGGNLWVNMFAAAFNLACFAYIVRLTVKAAREAR